MDDCTTPFIFSDSLSEIQQPEDLIVLIPGSIITREQLYDAFQRDLNFPYFQWNWDTLLDLLRDLWWIESRLIIFHTAVPELDTADLNNYLTILAKCATPRQPEEPPRLLMVFPKAAQAEVCSIIKK
jgi:hypothetical protein